MKKTIRLTALFLLVCITCLCFVACTPSSIDAAKDKMVKAGYSVTDHSVDEPDGFVGAFFAYKGLFLAPDSSITAVLFDTEEDAVNAINNIIFFSSFTQDGKWIYKGDEEAVKAFTKMF